MLSTLSSYVCLTVCLAAQPPGLGESVESLGLGVLVADSGQLYEGRIDRVGNLYRVMSAGRSEMVRDVNVVFTGQTKDDAYEFLKSKKKEGIAEDAAKLADWCKKYGLPKQAVDEARIAVRIAPESPVMTKLLRDCVENAKTAVTKPVIRVVGTAPAPVSPTHAAPPLTVPSQSTAISTNLPLSANTAELEMSFAKTVQPVLMNLCVNCHSDTTRPTGFQMTRLPEGITISSKSRQNIAAAVAQINKEQPATSPLLVMSLTAHGGRAEPPLIRNSTAYRNLENWVAAAAKVAPAKSVVLVSGSTPVERVSTTSPAAPAPLPVLASVPSPPAPKETKPVDPFDPAEFNKTVPDQKRP